MSKWAVIYSSVTGNTKLVAEAIARAAGEDGTEVDVFRVQDAPADVSGYDVVVLGYWLRLGAPDPLMLKYMGGVHGTNVVFVQTHGTEPTSEHAVTSFARAGYALGDGCEILGTFGCMGKINPALQERRKNAGPDDPHGGPHSLARWKRAASHPDEEDLANAAEFARKLKHKLVMREAFRAKKAAKLAAMKAQAAAKKADQ